MRYLSPLFLLPVLLIIGCSIETEKPVYNVTHQCPAGTVHEHRISPSLHPAYAQGVTEAVAKWSEVLGDRFPQRVVVSDLAADENITCVTSWLPSHDLDESMLGLTEAGTVKLTTRDGIPDNIKHQLPVHEMGHVLGLGDAKVMDSVMWKFIGPGQAITCEDRKNVCHEQGCTPVCPSH